MSDGDWLNDWRATAEKLGGLSRAKVFALWKDGGLDSVVIGSRRFSKDSQIAEFIAGLKKSA